VPLRGIGIGHVRNEGGKKVIPIAFIKWAKDARLFFIKTMKKIVA
jgi:hypothetical protein